MKFETQSGTFLGLFAHELRLKWRSLELSLAVRIIGISLLIIHTASGIWLGGWVLQEPIEANSYLYIMILLGALATLMVNIASSLRATQQTLYEHSDLELLLTSPISPRRVIMAKLASISFSTILFNVLFIFPLLIPVALFKNLGLLGLPIVVFAISICAACIGFGLTISIVSLFGPIAARKYIQVLGALTGASIFIVSQLLPQMNDGSGNGRIYDWFFSHGIGVDGFTSMLGRAGFGDPISLAIVIAVALAVFWFTTWSLQEHFLRSFQAAGNKLSRKTAKQKNINRLFSDRIGLTLIRKETVLLLRDPALIFHILLQFIFLVPIILGVAKAANLDRLLPTAAFLSVFGAGKLIGDITGLTVSGEDAPDLLTVSPREPREIRRWKIMAALLLSAPLSLLIPLFLISKSLMATAIILAFVVLAGCLTATIELSLSRPAPRRKFARRGSASVFASILILFTAAMLGGICAFVVS